MPSRYFICICISLTIGFLQSLSSAAVVDRVVGKANVTPKTILRNGDTVSTGKNSQLDVSLEKGFFRVGSETGIHVITEKNFSFEQGIVLTGSQPKKFLRPSVSMTVPGYKLELKGTAQIAFSPGEYLKIVVVEGKVKVALQSLSDEWKTLELGECLIINPADKVLPEPTIVDIGRLMETSALMKEGGYSTEGLVNTAISDQKAAINLGDLVRTPLRLNGASPEVTVSLPNRQPANALTPDEVQVFNLVNDVDNPNANIVERTFANATVFSQFPTSESGGDFTITREGARTQQLTVNLTSSADDFGQFAGPPIISGRVRVDADVFSGTPRLLEFQSMEYGLSSNEVLNGTTDYALRVAPGTDIETPRAVSLGLVGDVGLNIEGARLSAGPTSPQSGREELSLQARSRGLSITNSQLEGGRVVLRGSTKVPTEPQQAITVDSTKVNARQGIQIGTMEKKTVITVRNSTELNALAETILIQSAGGEVTVDASLLTAKGDLVVDSFGGASFDARMALINSTLSADVIRARGFASGGDALLIDGSTMNAAKLIQLYGEGASALRFRNDVRLNTPLAILAGRIVTVDAGGRVRISGRGEIYADQLFFNTAGHGTIEAVGGLSTKSHASRPAFRR